MAENKHNPDHADWMLLLEQLETDLQNGEPLTEEQIQNLEELRALVAETSDALELYARLDVRRGWQELRATAQERGLIPFESTAETQVHKHPTRRLWSRIAAVAALLLIISISGYFLYQQQPKDGFPLASFESDVLPGSNRATLTLADGSKIDLSDQQEGIVIGHDDIQYIDGSSILSNKSADGIKSDESDIGDEKLVLSTPRGGQYQVTLPDGTKVWLNAASTLTYPVQFTGRERRVELEGEAYFEVSSQRNKPFIVLSEGQKVTVFGTSFNVNKYRGQNVGATTLLSGSVEVMNTYTMETHDLIPGQQSLVSLQKINVNDVVDAEDYLAWKNGFIIMNEATLKDVIPQLERWYDVSFEMKRNPLIRAYIALDRRVNLSEVLDALALNYQVHFEIEGRRVLVIQ